MSKHLPLNFCGYFSCKTRSFLYGTPFLLRFALVERATRMQNTNTVGCWMLTKD